MWQEIIAGALVVGAAAFLTRRFWWKKSSSKASSGCASCSGCGSSTKGHCG
jgi:hypothetical protein